MNSSRLNIVGCVAGVVLLLIFVNKVQNEIWSPQSQYSSYSEEFNTTSASLNNDTITSSQSIDVISLKNRSYAAQELSIAAGNPVLDSLELVSSQNSDPLPPRLFSDSASVMCARTQSQCVPDHIRIQTLIVAAPNHRLASCVIQKSMSTVMSALFCFLTRQEEFIAQGRSLLREYPDITLCEHKNEYPGVKQMQLADNISDSELEKWRFTMVTRDPVDRFLSGFIDRCIRVGDHCSGCKQNMTCFMIEEHKRMLEFARVSKWKAVKLTMEDIHTFPQTWRCNMDAYADKYDFLKYSNDVNDGFLDQLVDVLRQSNVTESSISFITDSMSSGRTAHSTVTTPVRAFLENRLRESPYLMELITRMFYYDYTKLNYPLPTL